MLLLNILGNENLLMIAETLVIIVGSMLMGILLAYLSWGGYKKQAAELQQAVADEKRKVEDLQDQQKELLLIQDHLKSEIADLRLKADTQARMIFDQNHNLFSKESEHRHQKGIIDGLNATIESYQKRLQVIEEELSQAKNAILIPHKSPSIIARANYEHVSQLLGKQVTENDLTVITGVGPKTAALLQSNGYDSWAALSKASVDSLKSILTTAGGVYKSLDPSNWPKQALMAAQSEWRKLRIFQASLRKPE